MRFKGRKEPGEPAELCFMTRAKGLGMGVLKPYGDSRLYDVAVEDGGEDFAGTGEVHDVSAAGERYSLNILGRGGRSIRRGRWTFLRYSLSRFISGASFLMRRWGGGGRCTLRRGAGGHSGLRIGRLGSCCVGKRGAGDSGLRGFEVCGGGGDFGWGFGRRGPISSRDSRFLPFASLRVRMTKVL
jgi:hypothetical protein